MLRNTSTSSSSSTTGHQKVAGKHHLGAIPLIKVAPVPDPSTSSVRYVATGITPEAERLLKSLSGPLFIVAFAGYGRSGKSFTATRIRHAIAKDGAQASFHSAPGNVPCTHGIDIMVVPHPLCAGGHILLMDCEGGGNHNQTALPFVIGLAARLASKMYIFERGCFTTAGLESLVQILNMGSTTIASSSSPNSIDLKKSRDIIKSVVLCENMTINESISNRVLLQDLLGEANGDEMTNRIRRLVTSRFDIEFTKIPWYPGAGDVSPPAATAQYDSVIIQLADLLVQSVEEFKVGGVAVDGRAIVTLTTELLSQVRGGGSRYNMVSATEALVSNMATETAKSLWDEFIIAVKRAGNHPLQINGRKHLRTILRQVAGLANSKYAILEEFINKLSPPEAALVGITVWNRNYHNFEMDLRAAHAKKAAELAKYSAWTDRLNRVVTEMVYRMLEACRQFIRFARFSSGLLLMSNMYVWKQSLKVISSRVSNPFASSSSSSIVSKTGNKSTGGKK